MDGKIFTLITDHKAIEELRIKNEFGSARITRWFERLERFNFTVKYIKGTRMVGADALSRAAEEVKGGGAILCMEARNPFDGVQNDSMANDVTEKNGVLSKEV